MNDKKEFYIGWQDQMSSGNKSFIKKILISIFITIPLLAFVVVKSQKPFNQHQFEFGHVQEFTGIYHELPVPILEISSKNLPKGFSNHMLLVGYGKFGAEGIMKNIEERSGRLGGKKITLKGTLIYGDGKTLMELTEKERSLVKVHEHSPTKNQTNKAMKTISLTGEILDPKCYFGVMKPGEGKIHKSCAIRCISGGIPPVFRTSVEENNGLHRYYILLGKNGEKINKDILKHVAESISITGKVINKNGWNVIYIDPQSISVLN